MESTGKELRIHLSDESAHRLSELGGFELELRGRIEVKGKSSMTTYWLLGRTGFQFKIEPDACVYIPKRRKITQ